MTRNVLLASLALALVLIIGYFVFFRSNQSDTGNPSQNPAEENPSQNSVGVSISNFSFAPSNITVEQGTKVTWTNNDQAAHTVDSTVFNSPTLNQGQSFEYTFNTKGTFDYTCGIHPNMKGSVTVR
jgi:plastocyanin